MVRRHSRRFWSWRFLGVILPLIAMMDPAWCQDEPAHSGILYQIQSPTASAPSFLLGTIHSEDPRVLALPDPVRAAFAASPRFALEVVPDAEAILKSMITMTYTDGRTLREVLPPDLYGRTAQALGNLGMTPNAFADFKPWAVVTLLSLPPAQDGDFMDLILYRTAIGSGKEIKGLETMEEQLAIFDTMSEADQIALLKETLDARPQMTALFEDLIRAYLAQDLDALTARSERYLQDGDPRLAALFREAAVDSRNRRMAERLEPLLHQGGWFVAIGALHLPGEAGVLHLLEKSGFQVTPYP